MKFIKLTAFAVAGLWSGLVTVEVYPQDGQMLTREEALNRAVEAAYTLQAQEQQIAARGAEIKQADLKPNPFLSAEMENFTGTGPYTGFGQSEVSLNYNQMLERGDKRKFRRRVASQNKEIAKTEWRLIRLNIMQMAEQAYVKTLSAKMSYDNLNSQVIIFEQLLKTLEEYQRRGQTSSLAVQNARLQLLNINRQVEQQAINLQLAKQELANLWQSSDISFSIDTKEMDKLPATISHTSVNLEESPDLQLWQNQIGMAQENISLEKSKSKQDITVNVGVRYLQGTSDVAVIAGLSMPFAVYDTNINNVRRARAELNKSQINQMDAKRQIERQLLLQNQKKSAAYAQARMINTELIPEAEKTVAIALERLELGLANYLDVYTGQNVVSDFKAQLITELENFHLAESAINRLIAKYDTENISFDTIIQEQ